MRRKVELKLKDCRTEDLRTMRLTAQVFDEARATDYLSCRFRLRRESTLTLFATPAENSSMHGSDC